MDCEMCSDGEGVIPINSNGESYFVCGKCSWKIKRHKAIRLYAAEVNPRVMFTEDK